MGHLTVDQMIEFVSMDELNEKTVALSVSVNSHIRKCARCLRAVKAFQLIYDDFSGNCDGEDLGGCLRKELEPAAQELLSELEFGE